MSRLCRDPQCEHYGTMLPDEAFGRNAYYDTRGDRTGKSIYCRGCNVRRATEYKKNLRLLAKRTNATLPVSFRTDYHQKGETRC